jgi:tripartite-type tricarboxylate transporter receptor subunit TctC
MHHAVIAAASTLSAFACFASAAVAQNYPSRPIRVLITCPAACLPDVLARAIQQPMSQAWGQPIVVENRAGANGNIAMEACSKAAPDGYTACLPGGVNITLNPYAYSNIPYDAQAMTPIVLVGNFDQAIAVNASLPVKTMRDLVDLAKSKPGAINWASLGIGSTAHLYLEWFRATTGANMVHVPYAGSPQAVQALLSGEAQVSTLTPGLLSGHAAAGKVRVLAVVSGDKRSPAMPDVPTLREQGYDLDFRNWVAYYFPPATPMPLARRWNAEVNKLLADRAFTDKHLAPLSVSPGGGSPEDLAAFGKASAKVGEQLAKMSNLKFD